jgi:hypothetical protein
MRRWSRLPGEVPQLTDRLRRHETRPQQPALEQLTQPPRVACVGLPRSLLDDDTMSAGSQISQKLVCVLAAQSVGTTRAPGALFYAASTRPVLRPASVSSAYANTHCYS